MPLILGYKTFKDPANHIVTKFRKVVSSEDVDQFFYLLYHLFCLREGNGIYEICGIDGLIVYLQYLGEVGLKVCLKHGAFGKTLRDFERIEILRSFCLKQVIEKDLVDQEISGLSCGFVKVLGLPGKTPGLVYKPLFEVFGEGRIFVALVINNSPVVGRKDPYLFLEPEYQKLIYCLLGLRLFARMDCIEFREKLSQPLLYTLAVPCLFNIIKVLKFREEVFSNNLFLFGP